MPSPLTSFLPAVLLASPLLLSAAQPPTPSAPMPSAIALACTQSEAISYSTDLALANTSAESAATNADRGELDLIMPGTSAVFQQGYLSGEAAADNAAPNFQGYIVQPIAISSQALVTSEREWLALDTLLPIDSQENCSIKEEPLEVLQSPPEPAVNPAADADDSLPSDIPNLGVPPAPPIAPMPSPSGEPTAPTFTVPPSSATDSSATDSSATDGLPADSLSIPARPTSPPAADPALDPSNYTPTTAAPSPFDGNVVTTLESLPDGSYRYLAGSFEYGNYTNEQLIANGGSVFLLTKLGNEVTGSLYPQLYAAAICVTGTVSGDTVTGAAYPASVSAMTEEETDSPETDSPETSAPEASAENTEVEESFRSYEETPLQVRQRRTIAGQPYYMGALLDLSEFSRINAGSSLAPTSCETPTTDTKPSE
ncbi:MAG: hypothetical protein WA984_06800 [Phormidesmis sp.]